MSKSRLTSLSTCLLLASISLAGLSPNAFGIAPSTSLISKDSQGNQSVDQRFRHPSASDIPDFQRHVVPLLGRLGCNGRACHGSFQGRGGFQLSLFGYDFDADHDALLDSDAGRVDLEQVTESLVLAKPTDAEFHDGGKRMDVASWQYNLLEQWIRFGAKGTESPQRLVELAISPSSIDVQDNCPPTQLRVVAHWNDGTSEDVTALARFSVNDDGIATVDESGVVRVTPPAESQARPFVGATHVVVAYDNAVVPIIVQRPLPPSVAESKLPPTQMSDHPIDLAIASRLSELGIQPSERCSDAEFIRRVSLDIAGMLPSPNDVVEFLSSGDRNKREHLIDDLLASPGYGAWWATRMSDWTGNSEAQLNNVLPLRNRASQLWYEWLRTRIADNVPYDEIVEGMVAGNSLEDGESYEAYCQAMTQACQPGQDSVFAQRDGMPLYWARRNFVKSEERAIGFAYAFLGIRIECAQCHKHPFDRWSKDDFDQFAKCFENISARPNNVASEHKAIQSELLRKITGNKKLRGGELRRRLSQAAAEGKTVPFFELTYDNGRMLRSMQQRQKSHARRGETTLVSAPMGYVLGEETAIELIEDPRDELMAWLRDEANPYFAKSIVNRVWANYFGVGIVNPTDDMNLANPPSNVWLLNELADAFVRSGYDLKWLSRHITTSHAYQRSTIPNQTNQSDRVYFSRHVPRRLPAEIIHDAVKLATGSSAKTKMMRRDLAGMAIAAQIGGSPRDRNYALDVFGQSERESNCDCDRSDSPSLLQSMYLQNDTEISRMIEAKDSWVQEVCDDVGIKPSGDDMAESRSNRLRAEQIKDQVQKRIARFQSMAPKNQAAARGSLLKATAKARDRLNQYGFTMPNLNQLIRKPNAWSLQSAKLSANNERKLDWGSVVDQAYLRTLSRFPESDERSVAIAAITETSNPRKGLESLMWVLVNTKEFIVSH